MTYVSFKLQDLFSIITNVPALRGFPNGLLICSGPVEPYGHNAYHLKSECVAWQCMTIKSYGALVYTHTYGCSCSGQPLWQLFIWHCVPISMYMHMYFLYTYVRSNRCYFIYFGIDTLCTFKYATVQCSGRCTHMCMYIPMHAHRFARMSSAHRRVARLLRGNPHCSQAQAVSIQEQMGNHPGNSCCCAGLRLPKT